MSIKRNILLRVKLAFAFMVLMSGFIVFRMGKIQYFEGDKWINLSKKTNVEVKNIKATRGNIYADDGSLLATSLPFYQLAFDPSIPTQKLYNEKLDSLCFLLSKYFKDFTMTQYKRKIDHARKRKNKYVVLNRKELKYNEKKQIEQWPIFRQGRYNGGVIFEKLEKRFLPFSYLGYRTIGHIDHNGRGIVGLEYSFNEELAGKDGQGLFKKIAGGNWQKILNGSEQKPAEGYDIYTSIDVDIQDIAESSLLHKLKEHKADYGVVMVMEVETGEIKAIANLSKNNKGAYHERYNYAVGEQGVREPGSTFKLASIMALLENTDIEITDTVDTGNGVLEFFDRTMKDYKQGGFGKLTVKQAFEKSSNIGIAKLVYHYFERRPEDFINFLKKIKLDQQLDFQIVGTGKPYIKNISDSTWSGVTLPWMSHGYELKISPLQILTLYNSVANNGKMVKPIIVKKIMKTNKIITTFDTQVINKKICSKKTLQKVKLMLEGVVENGTASSIKNNQYKIAGKTGTAKNVKNGKYVKEYYTSFVGYFPADNPKYSCIVVIDNPKGYRIHGASVSAPVFREIADKIYSLELDLHTIGMEKNTITGVFPHIKSGKRDELSMICNELGISNHTQTQSEWVTTNIVNDAIYWKENQITDDHIPNVRGMTLRDAIYILENMGLKVSVSGKGRVKYQSLHPGQKVRKGITIKLNMES